MVGRFENPDRRNFVQGGVGVEIRRTMNFGEGPVFQRHGQSGALLEFEACSSRP